MPAYRLLLALLVLVQLSQLVVHAVELAPAPGPRDTLYRAPAARAVQPRLVLDKHQALPHPFSGRQPHAFSVRRKLRKAVLAGSTWLRQLLRGQGYAAAASLFDSLKELVHPNCSRGLWGKHPLLHPLIVSAHQQERGECMPGVSSQLPPGIRQLAEGYYEVYLGSQGGRTVALGVHRFVCWWVHGPPPRLPGDDEDGEPTAYVAAHTCGFPNCLNPHHLRWLTQAENAQCRVKHLAQGRGPKGFLWGQDA